MPESLKSKSVLIADHGLFVELAPRLSRDFGQVKYFMPWVNAYPKSAAAHVGFGIPGVERVEHFWDHVPDADLVVFADLYFADLAQVVSEKFGKPVWSHRRAEMLELDRIGTRRLQRDLGIPAPKTKFLTGVDALAEHLQKVKDNKYIKISCYRGDAETWQHEAWSVTEIYLDHFRNRVGGLQDRFEFMVEDEVKGIEIGYDGWTVNGEFPSASYWGIEIKDRGYVGRFQPYDQLPEALRDMNARIAPVLRTEQAVGFCSFECRIGDDKVPRLIDPCMRLCSPPSEATIEGFDNLSEIIWEGAHGRVATPKALGEYVAEVMIHSPFALTNWVPIEVPAADRRWLKLRNVAILDKKLYHVPTGGEMPEIGAVVAVADTLEEAQKLVRERAERVKGYNLDIKIDALDAADEEIDKAKSYGVDFHASGV